MHRSRSGALAALIAIAISGAVPASAAPANDALTNATLVSRLPFRKVASVAGATRESGEKSTSCAFGEASVWFEVKLSETADVAVTTSGSTYDTAIAVFRGTARTHSSLRFVDCVNDLGAGKRAAIGFEAAAGTRYFLQVSAASGAPARLEIRITTGEQILIPETSLGGAGSLHARVIVARDDSETEIVGRERVQGCYVGFCLPILDTGHETTDQPRAQSSACVLLLLFVVQQCVGPEQ